MLLVILAALIVAGGTGFYIVQGLNPASPEAAVQAEAPTRMDVFVPARELAAGALIKPEHLSRIKIAQDAITGEMIVAEGDGESQLVGSVARQVLPAGVPIARSAIVQPGDRGFLAAVLPKGKRAITIPIGEVAGLAGLVLPGDRVDIILTYSVAASGVQATETVLTNLRVLALDQRFQSGQPMGSTDDGEDAAPIARAATLEVTPQQAETVTLATSLGTLSLVLNSVRDGGEAPDAVEPGANRLTQAAAMRRGPGIDAFELQPRRTTRDSEITTLLRRVQVVRGSSAAATQPGAEPPAEAAAEAAAPAAE
jgi:pilus assembly protein CpaB